MDYRRELAVALIAFAVGCSGKTQVTSDGGGDDSSSSGGGSSSSGGGSSGGDGIDATVSGSGSGGSSGSSSGRASDSGADSGTGATLDAEISDAYAGEVPDAFPASCGPNAFVLRPDAAANTCAFTPADVACNTNADCSTYTAVSCGCSDAVWGVNKTNTVRCIPPPCPPPANGCDPDASGLYTEDCQLVPFDQTVVAACVNHRCLSFAPAAK